MRQCCFKVFIFINKIKSALSRRQTCTCILHDDMFNNFGQVTTFIFTNFLQEIDLKYFLSSPYTSLYFCLQINYNNFRTYDSIHCNQIHINPTFA